MLGVASRASAGSPSPDDNDGRSNAVTPLRAASTAVVDTAVASSSVLSAAPTETVAAASPSSLLARITEPVANDMVVLQQNLINCVGERHPMLMAASQQIFKAGGKRLRPLITLLIGRATIELTGMSDLTERHKRLAEITEMIHTASLLHDDVLDDCDVRRGSATVNNTHGSRIAILAGDYLFAQSSWGLAQLDNLEVIKLISQVIADFANGEISQAMSLFDTELTLQAYLDKSFYKTASLIAASCRGAAVFSEVPTSVKEAMFDYGKHLGLAFQVVDDILDYTTPTEQLGKPQGQDLASGNLTAPVLFALRNEAVSAQLLELIENEFQEAGDLEKALELVRRGGGIETARTLARQEADLALAALDCLPDSDAKRSLQLMVDYVLDRLY